jgi:CheY-like chemotaxis protein
VIIYLPLTKNQPRADAPVMPTSAPPAPAHTVLLVEDEASVRSTVRRQLETLGHTVLVADSASEAIPILESDRPPDVLLTDVVLGSGMNGIDLADAARAVRPRMPVIFMSGFTAEPEARKRITDSGAPLLAKPATLLQLERALNAVTVDSRQDTSTS